MAPFVIGFSLVTSDASVSHIRKNCNWFVHPLAVEQICKIFTLHTYIHACVHIYEIVFKYIQINTSVNENLKAINLAFLYRTSVAIKLTEQKSFIKQEEETGRFVDRSAHLGLQWMNETLPSLSLPHSLCLFLCVCVWRLELVGISSANMAN